MIKLESIKFPHRYLACLEAALVAILRGKVEVALLAGTQAYFVFNETNHNLAPRANYLEREWERVLGLVVEHTAVSNDTHLRTQIVSNLDKDIPICLPVDIYYLPYTSHHNQLHLEHFVDIFGYDDNRYYIVCPYYQFMGWLDSDVVHKAFFSSPMKHKSLLSIPQTEWRSLSFEEVFQLVENSCHGMLGMMVPEAAAHMPSHCLGLAGIHTLTHMLREQILKQNKSPRHMALRLSAEIMAIGYSRYWFYELIKLHREHLLRKDAAGDLEERFAKVVHSWRSAGMRLGAGAHKDNYKMMQQAVLRLEQVYTQEMQLFNRLLGALQNYEEGKL